MFKTITAAILSLAVAASALIAPTQAHADRNDVARIVGGLAALAIIGAAIDAANDDNNNGRVVIGGGAGYRNPVIGGGAGYRPPAIGGGHRLVLPAQCRRNFHTDRGVRAFFNRRCTQNNVARPHLLPNNCLRQIRTDRGLRNFYAGPCMRRAGWVF